MMVDSGQPWGRGFIAQPSYARGAPADFHVGYQKAGLFSVAKEQRALGRWVNAKWSEFALGPPMMDAVSKDAIDFGWVGEAPAIIAQSAGAKFVYAACMLASQHAALMPEGPAIRAPVEIK